MERRRIQLIAGTTYSVSLPKEWVKKNNLKEKSEIIFQEGNDRNLILSPQSIEEKRYNEIALNIDDYLSSIDQVLFAVYYLGVENISLFSKNGISKEVGLKIRKTISHMSGTEISYEDNSKIVIKVLLDKSKVDITQVIYRVSLIIESSISSIIGDFNIEEIRIDENEIDRLYHLITKIISLSLIDSAILHSSKIKNSYLIPSYFLLCKKLENIGDNIMYMAENMAKNKSNFENKKEILNFVSNELKRSISYIIGKQQKVFEKLSAAEIKNTHSLALKIKDKLISTYVDDIIRYIIDIEEEVVNISFYNKLFSNQV